jgi:hypothetical protein
MQHIFRSVYKHAIASLACLGLLTGCVDVQPPKPQDDTPAVFLEEVPLSASCRTAQTLYEQGKIKEFMNSPCVQFVWGMSAGHMQFQMIMRKEEPPVCDSKEQYGCSKQEQILMNNLIKEYCFYSYSHLDILPTSHQKRTDFIEKTKNNTNKERAHVFANDYATILYQNIRIMNKIMRNMHKESQLKQLLLDYQPNPNEIYAFQFPWYVFLEAHDHYCEEIKKSYQ